MPDASDLLRAFRSHLVTAAVARMPTGTPAQRAPVYLQPEGGAVGPGDKKGNEANADVVLSAFHSGGLRAPTMEEFWRRDTVDLWLRVRKAPFAAGLEAEVRALVLGDIGQRNWDKGAGADTLRVIASQEWRPLQPIGNPGVPGHTFIVSYLFEYYA